MEHAIGSIETGKASNLKIHIKGSIEEGKANTQVTMAWRDIEARQGQKQIGRHHIRAMHYSLGRHRGSSRQINKGDIKEREST